MARLGRMAILILRKVEVSDLWTENRRGLITSTNHHHLWYHFCLMPINFLAPVSNCANCSSGEKSKGRVRKVQAVVHLKRYLEFVFDISMRCRWMFFISVCSCMCYCIRGLLLVSRWLREVAGRSCLVVGLRWSDPPPPLLSCLWSGFLRHKRISCSAL